MSIVSIDSVVTKRKDILQQNFNTSIFNNEKGIYISQDIQHLHYSLYALKMKDTTGTTVVASAVNAETKDNGENNSDSTSANSSLGDSFRESGKKC